MSSFARKVKRNELKKAFQKRKERYEKMNPGKKFVDVKFNKLWARYQETIKNKEK